MHDTQLLGLLKSFSAYEMNSFGRFVQSPFFNTNKMVVKFYKLLEKHHPFFTEAPLLKQNIFKKLYPGKKYDDKRIRYLTYELLKLAEEFLGQINYKKDIFNSNIHSLKELIERNQTKLAYKKIRDAENNLTPENYPNEVYFYNRHLLKSRSNYLELLQDKTPDSNNIIAEGENIILLAFVVIFQTTFNLFITNRTFNQQVASNIIYDFLSELNVEKLITKARKIPGDTADTIEFYYRLMLLQLDPDDNSNFEKLKLSFDVYAKKLNNEDLYNFYTALRSFCVQKVLRGEKFRKEQFEIDKLAIKYDAYSPAKNKYFQLLPFRNFLISALSEFDFEWVDELISEYLYKVNPKFQSDLLNFSKAAGYFLKMDYENSLKYTNLLSGSHIFFKYDKRAYTLMNYYELGMLEPALEYIDSYRHFLNKNKSVSTARRMLVLDNVNFTHDLILLRLNSSKKNILYLKKQIEENTSISNKSWLLKKAEELINNK